MKAVLLGILTLGFCSTSEATIINIDSSHGFTYDGGGSDPAPVPGQHLNLIGTPVQLTLAAGTYQITNAAGLPGASFNAWSYNVFTASWAWAFVIVNDSTRNTILYAEAGGGSSAAQVAALPAVQNFSTTLTLASTTTLDFTLRDYFVSDNAGGISLNITAVGTAVPEPSTELLIALALAMLSWAARRRRLRSGS